MLTIKSTVEEILENNREAQNMLSQGLLNTSSYAKTIFAEVKKKTKKDLSLQTIVVTLNRLKRKLRAYEYLPKIAIANILTESIKQQGVILKQDTNQSDQMKDIQILSENTERKVVELLNDDQKEKYKIFKEESKNPKKSKKNR